MRYIRDAWNVILVDEVDEWFVELSHTDQDASDAIAAAIDMLEEHGPMLGRPLVDSITGSNVHNLNELRVNTARILFVFDPTRSAILLVAGDKAGAWKRWYSENIPLAEDRYRRWLAGEYTEEND
ncbi:type II toxin-antitoxin system RelE/ParE family toxin [Cellulomonas sp. Leaf334]|uniref:type II toxin-antitoxin system RelE/ParE family toxin n=1 Tax=Cellulomonas sp. Leaf334 TaxID=1736339 RepID=UPI0006F2635D|nr:type II toxin-antitoxin system RelE/ParE family toxin [Cellulomonas sp. Leaf334]KQR10925.1 hypothetical protein ASF78_14650 [Cellulomonas sp. Leaf334]